MERDVRKRGERNATTRDACNLHLFSFVCMYGTYAGIQIAWMDHIFRRGIFLLEQKFRKRKIFCGRVIKESFSWLFFPLWKGGEGGRYQSFCGTTTTILEEEEEEEEDMISSSLLPPNPPPLTHLQKSWERRKSPTKIVKSNVFHAEHAVCLVIAFSFLYCWKITLCVWGMTAGGNSRQSRYWYLLPLSSEKRDMKKVEQKETFSLLCRWS